MVLCAYHKYGSKPRISLMTDRHIDCFLLLGRWQDISQGIFCMSEAGISISISKTYYNKIYEN